MTTTMVIFALCIIVTAGCVYYSLNEKSNLRLMYGFFAIFTALLTLVFAASLGKDFLREELAKEVTLEQVPLKGQKNFTAVIQIVYKDGKLDSLSLSPKTTTLKEAK